MTVVIQEKTDEQDEPVPHNVFVTEAEIDVTKDDYLKGEDNIPTAFAETVENLEASEGEEFRLEFISLVLKEGHEKC